MNDNLDEFFETFLANDAKKAQEKEAKIAEEQKKYEAQHKVEMQKQEKEELDKSFINAIRYNNIDKAKEAFQKGADVSYLDMGFDGKNKWYGSVEYKAYAKNNSSFAMANSAEMVDFLLSDVMDMKNPKHREVAQTMLDEAFFRDEKSADKFIQMAKDNGLSLDGVMKNIVSRSQDILGMYNKLTKAGASQEAFAFSSLDDKYHYQKFGYWGGRDGDHWVEPQSDKAAETRKILMSIIKSGYRHDLETSTIAKELAYEYAYEKFSAQDKKLIADLKNDNIDEIRKSLVDGRLPDNVEQYMKYVPYEEERGTFFSHYKEMMYDEYGNERDVKPYTLENAERSYIQKENIDKAIEAMKFNPKGCEDIIANRFCDEFKRRSGYHYDSMHLANHFSKMNPECKKAVAEKLVPILDEKLSNTKITFSEDRGYATSLLAFTLKMYDSAEESGKNALRSTMLKFRTTGSNEDRRQKAELYKKALSFQNVTDIKKDETVKAVSSVSYTPLSSLNRQLMKHGKEIEGR